MNCTVRTPAHAAPCSRPALWRVLLRVGTRAVCDAHLERYTQKGWMVSFWAIEEEAESDTGVRNPSVDVR